MPAYLGAFDVTPESPGFDLPLEAIHIRERFSKSLTAHKLSVCSIQLWAREKELSARDGSLITVTALMSTGVLDSSIPHNL